MIKTAPRSKSAKRSGTTGMRKKIPQTRRSRSSRAPVKRKTFIVWVNTQWNRLGPHHQKCVLSTFLLILSLLLFSALTVFHAAPILNWIDRFFLTLFGWSAYLVALGLVAFAVAHLIEGIRQQQFMHLRVVAGMVVVWLLLLTESALILRPASVGLLGTLLVTPLLGWSLSADHVIILGLLLITTIVTFRLRFGHILLTAHYLHALVVSMRVPHTRAPRRLSRTRP